MWDKPPYLLIANVCLFLGLISCESSYNELIYLDSASFTVTEIQISDSTFTAKGTVQNESNYSYHTPWYFTYDVSPLGASTADILTGQHTIQENLDCEQRIDWEISYDVDFFRKYDDVSFQMNNFTAYYIIE